MHQVEHIEERRRSAADDLSANSNYTSTEYFLPVMGRYSCATHANYIGNQSFDENKHAA